MIVVDVISYYFDVGIYVCLLGLFGCGKFLILWMIVGYEIVFDGVVIFGGWDILYLLFVKCGMVMMF